MNCIPQEFLRMGGTLAELTLKYGINVKRHGTYPNLVQLKYGKADCDFSEPIICQSRGLILDEYNNWSMVARPMDKFFNAHEPQAATIDWNSATVLEKLDGSLMILYYYKDINGVGNWHVATSGLPDASGEVNGSGWTFRELFWSVWKEMGYNLPGSYQQYFTFMFEMTTPYNQVVVKHKDCSLRLIAIRNCVTGDEMAVRNHSFHYERVKAFHELGSGLDSITRSFDLMDPTIQEGYVVVDKFFNRVKVKHPDYVALHHLRSSLTPMGILDVVQRGESTEVLSAFPEWKGCFEQVQAAYDGLLMHLTSEYNALKDIPLGDDPEEKRMFQKMFAQKAIKSIGSGVLFALRQGHVSSVKDGLVEMRLEKLGEILRVKDIKLELEYGKVA